VTVANTLAGFLRGAQEELDDVRLGCRTRFRSAAPAPGHDRVALHELLLEACDRQEGRPTDVLADRQVDVRVPVDEHDAGHVLGPLEVAAGPVERLGRSAEQGLAHGWHLSIENPFDRHGYCAISMPAASAGSHSLRSSAMSDARWGIGGSAIAPSTTQVSLLPPPCEEFTMSEPSGLATRVSPPGSHTSPRAEQGERAQVDVARGDLTVDQGGHGRQPQHRLRDPAGRMLLDPASDVDERLGPRRRPHDDAVAARLVLPV